MWPLGQAVTFLPLHLLYYFPYIISAFELNDSFFHINKLLKCEFNESLDDIAYLVKINLQ